MHQTECDLSLLLLGKPSFPHSTANCFGNATCPDGQHKWSECLRRATRPRDGGSGRANALNEMSPTTAASNAHPATTPNGTPTMQRNGSPTKRNSGSPTNKKIGTPNSSAGTPTINARGMATTATKLPNTATSARKATTRSAVSSSSHWF